MPQTETHKTPESPCPYCGYVLDAATGGGVPEPGDVTICIQCIEFGVLDENLKVRKPTADELKEIKADNKMRIAQYLAQLASMSANGRKWLDAHPGADIKVQFNFPKEVGLIQAISQAVKTHSVSANETGLEFLKALWRWDVQSEPTVMMCKKVIHSLIK